MSAHYTLSSYDPVYVIAPEVRIPETLIQEHALRWLEYNVCREGETAKLTDQFVDSHCDDFHNVKELLIFIRYNMYKDNLEGQQLSDQDYVCRELSGRLVEDLPADLVEECVFAAKYRLEDMIMRQGKTIEDFCKEKGVTEEELYNNAKERALQSLKEDSALQAWADHFDLDVEAEDFYAIIPGDSIEEKARKRRQIELEGRLAPMEEYARKTKALKMIMEDARIKRKESDTEWLRYGDTAADVLEANKKFPEAFTTL